MRISIFDIEVEGEIYYWYDVDFFSQDIAKRDTSISLAWFNLNTAAWLETSCQIHHFNTLRLPIDNSYEVT